MDQPVSSIFEPDPRPSASSEEPDPRPSTSSGEADPRPSTSSGEADPRPSTSSEEWDRRSSSISTNWDPRSNLDYEQDSDPQYPPLTGPRSWPPTQLRPVPPMPLPMPQPPLPRPAPSWPSWRSVLQRPAPLRLPLDTNEETQHVRKNVTRGITLRSIGMLCYDSQVSIAQVLRSAAERNLLEKNVIDLKYVLVQPKEVHDRVRQTTFLMVYSKRWQYMASAHGDRCIYLNDYARRNLVKVLVGHDRTSWSLAMHPTRGHLLASGCLGGVVKIWDIRAGAQIHSRTFGPVIASIAFHPFHQLLVVAAGNLVHLWDWEEDRSAHVLDTSKPTQKVRYVAFDPLGSKLITAIGNPITAGLTLPLASRNLFSRISFDPIPSTSFEDRPFDSSLPVVARIDTQIRRERDFVDFDEEGDFDGISYRIQAWDFTKERLPELTNPRENIVVPRCKLSIDTGIDISSSGTKLAACFDDGAGVFSLNWNSLGGEICRTYIEGCVVAVGISPTEEHLIVGLANSRHTSNFIMIKVYKLTDGHPAYGRNSNLKLYYKQHMTLVRQFQGIATDPGRPMSLNAASWAPVPGLGIVYSTTQGRLAILQ